MNAEETETKRKEVNREIESWVTRFCNKKGNEMFCQVDESYFLDDTNLNGLSSKVPCYDYALDLILDAESSHGISYIRYYMCFPRQFGFV